MRRVWLVVGGLCALYFVVIPVLERIVPRSWLRVYWRITTPSWIRIASYVPGFAAIETTGRKTGRKHVVPVGGRLSGNTFWFAAANPDLADYVRNIKANPNVTLRIHGRRRNGIAKLCPEERPRRWLVRMNPLNSIFIAVAAKKHLVIRIDLDPQ